MKTMQSRLLATGFGAMSLTLLVACAVTDYSVEGSTGVGYVGSYYEPYYEPYYDPYGYGYGGWGGSYWVGPGRWGEGGERREWRDGDRRDWRGGDRAGDRGGDHGGDRGRAPAYRPAPGGRSAPSIPNRPRGH
jgi:hypothetical protein